MFRKEKAKTIGDKWEKTAAKAAKTMGSHPGLTWGVILIVCFTIYSSFYVPHVIMPQQGWWQYYASRVLQGDVLYKDLYLWMPPYYVFFVCIFYPLFKSHFLLYTIFVGYPIKILCLLILYKIIKKIVPPAHAAISVFVGAVISSTFLMDAWFDYNPILMLPCLLFAYCITEYYAKREDQRKRLVLSFAIGVLCGILLMSKQTFGLAFAVVGLLMIVILHVKERIPKAVWSLVSMILGLVVGLLPACVYFVYYDCWGDFLNCLNIATGAKGGIGGLLNHLIAILSSKSGWIIAISSFALIVLLDTEQSNPQVNRNKKRVALLKVCLICCVMLFSGRVFYSDFSHLLTVIKGAQLELYILILALCGLFLLRLEKEHQVLTVRQKEIACVALLIIAMLFCAKVSPNILQYLYDNLDIFGFRRKLIIILSYLFILFWAQQMFRYFVQREPGDYSLLMFLTVMAAHFFVGIISAAVLEEIFMVLYVPFSIALLFQFNSPRPNVKNGMVAGCALLLTILCLICKLYIPYDWQGWRVTPISSDDVYCDVKGLEGLKVSRETNDAYTKIVDLILEETEPDDAVYSFANTALFNVLTERKTPTYAPIAWFDVCPDAVAEADAELLEQDPPKVIVWQNMDQGQWNHLESVFRNGEQSGQRNLIKFYETFVKNNYTLEVEVNNHRDGTLQAWKRNENYFGQDELSELFGGGTGTVDDPFIIKTTDQLEQFRDMVNMGYSFKNQYLAQTRDIDLSGVKNWVPIGIYDSPNQFMGTYDGRGHVIKNMHCRANDNVGLFGMLGGTVCNLGVVDSYVKGKCVGVISSHAYCDSARIINCYTECTVRGTRAGGIVDNFSGSVINCISYSKCIGDDMAGAVSYYNGSVSSVWADYTLVSAGILDAYGNRGVSYVDSDYLSDTAMKQNMNAAIEQIDSAVELLKWEFSKDGRLILDSSAK